MVDGVEGAAGWELVVRTVSRSGAGRGHMANGS